MNKILLITTKGCFGCDIMRKSIKDAIAKTKVDIDFTEEDVEIVDKKLLKKFDIKDFPCVIFFKNNKYLFKKVGSVPEVVVVQWINVHFK